MCKRGCLRVSAFRANGTLYRHYTDTDRFAGRGIGGLDVLAWFPETELVCCGGVLIHRHEIKPEVLNAKKEAMRLEILAFMKSLNKPRRKTKEVQK